MKCFLSRCCTAYMIWGMKYNCTVPSDRYHRRFYVNEAEGVITLREGTKGDSRINQLVHRLRSPT